MVICKAKAAAWPVGSRAALLVAALALQGCALWRPVTVPLATIELPARCTAKVDTLIAMLPGSWSRPEEFIPEGFVAALRERRIAADVLLVDAHLGYYSDRSVVTRLRADVLVPARARGYAHVWLVGISVGAFGALLMAQEPDAELAGVVALGPFLGRRGLSTEIAAQGGLARWRAPSGPLPIDDGDVAIWRRLQTEPLRPPLYLGYGRADRFAYSDDLLAAALPADHVYTTEGGHDWPPWRALWQRMLDALPLPRDASCAGG